MTAPMPAIVATGTPANGICDAEPRYSSGLRHGTTAAETPTRPIAISWISVA